MIPEAKKERETVRLVAAHRKLEEEIENLESKIRVKTRRMQEVSQAVVELTGCDCAIMGIEYSATCKHG